MLRPARASSMMRRRYSGAYGGCVRGMGNLLFYFSPNTVHESGSTPNVERSEDARWKEGRGLQEGQPKTRKPARNPGNSTKRGQPTKEEQTAKSHLIPVFKRVSLELLGAFA